MGMPGGLLLVWIRLSPLISLVPAGTVWRWGPSGPEFTLPSYVEGTRTGYQVSGQIPCSPGFPVDAEDSNLINRSDLLSNCR